RLVGVHGYLTSKAGPWRPFRSRQCALGSVESSGRIQQMISCNLTGVKRVLFLGAHSDDIEIGCGGTVLRMIEQSKSIEFYWLVLCSSPTRAGEEKRRANAFLGVASKKTYVMEYFIA